MNTAKIAEPKNKNSQTSSPSFGKESERTDSKESNNSDHDVLSPLYAHSFGKVQVGSQSVNLSSPPRIQTKLKIGSPNDKYEQEADQVAEQIMRMPDPQVNKKTQVSGNSQTPHIQRMCTECEEEEEEIIQAKEIPGQTPAVTPEVNTQIDSMRGGGQQLPETERAFFESCFRRDFSRVRIHTDNRTANITNLLKARAFTVGKHIGFGVGQYRPETKSGKKLLAHELTHTIHQKDQNINHVQLDRRHDRGHAGEQGVAFSHYSIKDGWIIVRGPSGAGGHGITASGEDGLAYNINSKVMEIYDNKSLNRRGNVSSATAIDPSVNLEQNLDSIIRDVESMDAREFPYKKEVLRRLKKTRAALGSGNNLPDLTKLVVWNSSGRSTGVTARLRRQGVTFRDVGIAPVKHPGVKTPHLPGISNPPSRTRPSRIQMPSSSEPSSSMPSSSVTPTGKPPRRVGRGIMAAGGIASDYATLFIINPALEEHFADYRAEGKRKMTELAIVKANPRFQEAIQAKRSLIENAQAQGRFAYLHYVVQTGSTSAADNDPIVGSGVSSGEWAYVSNILNVQIYLEGEQPKPHVEDNAWLDAFRSTAFDVSIRYEKHNVKLPGTDMGVRHQNEVIKEVESTMGSPAIEFEELVIRAQYGGLSKITLREYAVYRQKLAKESSGGRVLSQVRYWKRMEALTSAPIDEVISQAKVRSIPLSELRNYAIEQGSNVGEDPHAEDWSKVVEQIDAPLQERFAADRSRFLSSQPASKEDVEKQKEKIASMEKKLVIMEQRLVEAKKIEYRNNNEPDQPDYLTINSLEPKIKALREELFYAKKYLKFLEKGTPRKI